MSLKSRFLIFSLGSMLSALILPGRQAGSALYAQSSPDSLDAYFTFEDSSPLSCLTTWFPSLFIQYGLDLKDFVRSDTFAGIRRARGDAHAVDAIFVRAMQLTNNNTAVALFLSAVATFDHRDVSLKVPVFALAFPLSDESAEDFSARVKNLPIRLYDDTPGGATGDRDKLQHFFGSAFLAFAFESNEASMRVGEFVEEGEGAFIVGGADDDRDRRADRQGQAFGAALLENCRRFPSAFLGTRGHPLVHARRASTCPGAW
jgi:hypothetical protein